MKNGTNVNMKAKLPVAFKNAYFAAIAIPTKQAHISQLSLTELHSYL